jgi:hypothetical protein
MHEQTSFDGKAAQDEALIRLRGLADHFERQDPAMHKTNTVDYAVVYKGEMWLELDNGETLHLKRGDVVYKTGSGTPGGIKAHGPLRCFFLERCKGLTPTGLHPETRKGQRGSIDSRTKQDFGLAAV